MQKTLGNQPLSSDNVRDVVGVSAPPTPLTTPHEEAYEMADPDSTSGRAPAFQFYPKDFLADERVRLMSMPERGVYITLICLCWSEGTLPADTQTLSRIAGMPVASFRKLWPAVEVCFRPSPRDASRLIHPRLERERQKQRAYRRRQADNGRKGGRPPNSGKPTANPSLLQQPNQSPSSVLISSQSGSALISDFGQEKRPTADPVQRVVDKHEELHRKYVGVGYIGNAQKDYQAACDIVRAFPDPAMQDAILIYGLNDADPFMAKGTRTIPRIASNASKYAEELKARKLA